MRLNAVRPFAVNDLSDKGRVRVRGKASPGGALLKAPLSARSCVFYAVEVSEWLNGSKIPLFTKTSIAPFHLEDDTGKILLNPADTVEYHLRKRLARGHSSECPEQIRALLRRQGFGMLDEFGELRSLSFRELILVPGDSITAIGTISHIIDAEGAGSYREPPSQRVLGADADHALFLSDRS